MQSGKKLASLFSYVLYGTIHERRTANERLKQNSLFQQMLLTAKGKMVPGLPKFHILRKEEYIYENSCISDIYCILVKRGSQEENIIMKNIKKKEKWESGLCYLQAYIYN